MKNIRKRLTYANVMSSLAVFLVLGGATAFAATELAKNSVGTKQLKKNAVTAAKVKNNAVTAAKIKANAVTEAKIASNAVNSAKLGANAVETGKIANDAVTTGKLAPEAVTTGKIATDAVTGDKVAESTLAGVVKEVSYVSKASSGDSEDQKSVTIDCGPKRVVIGGFYQTFDFGPEVQMAVRIMRTGSISGEERRALEVTAKEITPDGDNWQLSATAVCASL